MPRIILACTHQIFISRQRRLKVSLFPSQTMESSSLGDRSSSPGSCACHLKALGIKADTTKDTTESCHCSSAHFSARFTGRNSEPRVSCGWVRDFLLPGSPIQSSYRHTPNTASSQKSGTTQIPCDAGTSRCSESSGMEKLKEWRDEHPQKLPQTPVGAMESIPMNSVCLGSTFYCGSLGTFRGVGWELCISALVPSQGTLRSQPQQQIKPLDLGLGSLSLLVPAEEALCSSLLAWFINPSTQKWIKSILHSPVSDEQECLSHHRIIKVGKTLKIIKFNPALPGPPRP